jgi:hypothetical protein
VVSARPDAARKCLYRHQAEFPPFTAVTRVRISYGTPSVFRHLGRFNGTLTGVMRQIYGMDATERHGMEAAPKRRIIARSSAVSRYEFRPKRR